MLEIKQILIYNLNFKYKTLRGNSTLIHFRILDNKIRTIYTLS